MKVSFSLSSLRAAWQAVIPFVPGRSTKEVLLNVKMTAQRDGIVKLCATNTEFGGEVEIVGDVARPGESLLHAAKFSDVLREISGENVTLSDEKGSLLILGAKAKIRLQTQDPSDFPTPQAFDFGHAYEVSNAGFIRLVGRLELAADEGGSRFALNGVKFEFGESAVNGFASDSKRVHFSTEPSSVVGSPKDYEVPVIVGIPPLRSICRSLPKTGTARVYATESEIRVQSGGARYWARLISGRYPKIDLTPKQNRNFAAMPAEELVSVVRQASLACDMETRGIDLVVGRSLHGNTLSARTDTHAGSTEIEATMDACEIPDGFRITVDYGFVLDYLKPLDKEEPIRLRVGNNGEEAIYLTNEAGDYWACIMPMAPGR